MSLPTKEASGLASPAGHAQRLTPTLFTGGNMVEKERHNQGEKGIVETSNSLTRISHNPSAVIAHITPPRAVGDKPFPCSSTSACFNTLSPDSLRQSLDTAQSRDEVCEKCGLSVLAQLYNLIPSFWFQAFELFAINFPGTLHRCGLLRVPSSFLWGQ